MQRRFWLWYLLSSCQPSVPSPPVAEDTTILILRELYSTRAQLIGTHTSPHVMESVLAERTAYLLQRYRIDSQRWELVRWYYAKYPQRWQAVLEKTLSSRE
ncbi:MAG: hypothetical protein RMK19_06410 [Bacteroidia bacterium]|nr:hypothetical protein [Bacteroidia bacterium]MDW8015626.1 hypothetical protein [Bacteroidia bacterium]